MKNTFKLIGVAAIVLATVLFNVWLAVALVFGAMVWNAKTSLGWKVPFRRVYCEAFRDWIAQTIHCHIVLRIGTKIQPPQIGLLVMFAAISTLLFGCANAHDGSKTVHEMETYSIVAPPGWTVIQPSVTNSAIQNAINNFVVVPSTNQPSWISELLDHPHVYVAYRERWEDKSRGGGTFVFTDPQASQLLFTRTNQNGLGGSRSVTVGSLQSTITTNAVQAIGAAGTAVGNVIGAAASAAAGK